MKNIFNEFSSIYEKHARDIFTKQDEDIQNENLKNIYEKYFQKCVDGLEKINTTQLTDKVENLEEEIQMKISEINQLRKIFKRNLIINKGIEHVQLDDNICDSRQSFPIVKNKICLSNTLMLLEKRVDEVSSKIQYFENQSTESTKKVKDLYENKISLPKFLYDMENKLCYQLKNLNESKNVKMKIFDEKIKTNNTNTYKVQMSEEEYKNVLEKFKQVESDDIMISQEIEIYNKKHSDHLYDIEKLQSGIRKKKNSKTSNAKYVLCDIDSPEQNQIKNEINFHIKEMENNVMIFEDFTMLNKIKNDTDNSTYKNKANMHLLLGMMMNSLSINKKTKSLKNMNEYYSNSSLELIKSIDIFNELKLNVSDFEGLSQINHQLKTKLEKEEEIQKKRFKTLNKIYV